MLEVAISFKTRRTYNRLTLNQQAAPPEYRNLLFHSEVQLQYTVILL